MNFMLMPEFDWTFRYLFELALIGLSAILPLLLLKLLGWL